MVFLDTSAWFAFFVPTDPYHEHVREWVTNNAHALVATDYCVDETLTLLMVRRERRRALDAGRGFFQRDVCRLHFLAPDEVRRAWLIFQQRAAAGWSVTDCTTRVVLDGLGIRKAIALDAHFGQSGGIDIIP